MRITQGMLNSQILNDIQNNYQRLSTLQNEISTGKKINSPSDDPIGVGFVMQYKGELAQYQQYQSNASSAQGWLNYTDSVMNQAQNTLKRARDLAVQGSNGTNSAQDRQALGAEVGQLYQQLVSIGNSQYNGQYIFNGQNTNTAPYDEPTAATQAAGTGAVVFDVGSGNPLQVNVSGQDYFGNPSATDNSFKALKDLQTALDNNNTQGIETAIGQIDSRTSTMQAAQAKVGAREDRVQFQTTRLSNLTQNVTSILSNTEDANMAKVIMDLQSAQNVQTASLQVGAKVMVPTLVDFLK